MLEEKVKQHQEAQNIIGMLKKELSRLREVETTKGLMTRLQTNLKDN